MSGILAALATGPVSSLLGPIVDKVLDFIPDPAEKARQMVAMQTAMMALDQKVIDAQNALNLSEAASDSAYKAGWRPLVGWVCAAGLAAQVVVFPCLNWGAALLNHPFIAPVLDSGLIMSLLVPMLGFAGYRTYEKTQGITNAPTGAASNVVANVAAQLGQFPGGKTTADLNALSLAMARGSL